VRTQRPTDPKLEGARVIPDQGDQLVDQQARQTSNRCRKQNLPNSGGTPQPAQDQSQRHNPDQPVR
jgi:hypothetical protein